jgi:choline-glycine betaine transporter
VKKLKPIVFFPPCVLLLVGIVLNFMSPEAFERVLTLSYQWVMHSFGWLVSFTAFLMLVVCAIIYISPFGKVVIGGPSAKPLLKKWNLFAVVLCTNIGIGILFWGPIEPLYHLSSPPASLGIAPYSAAAATFAMSTILLHWSFLPYVFPALIGLMFAFAYYNMRRPFSLGAPIAPLLGHSSGKAVGQTMDMLSLYTLVTGLAGSLGGVMLLLGGGFNCYARRSGATSNLVLAIICAFIATGYTLAAVSGLAKGIPMLANIKTVLLITFIVLILFMGPTRFIFGYAVEGLGNFLGNFFQKALFTGVISGDPWPQRWTEMHFSSWAAWALLTGVFFGRIGYGYSVRKFLLYNILLPGLSTGAFMAIFCGAVVHLELFQGAGLVAILKSKGPENVMYAFVQHFALMRVLTPLFLLAAFLSFITATAGVLCTMGGLSSTGISPESPESSAWLKILWGAIIGTVSWIMIAFARIDGIRMLSSLAGPPSLLICLAVVIAALRVMSNPCKFDLLKDGYDTQGNPLKFRR